MLTNLIQFFSVVRRTNFKQVLLWYSFIAAFTGTSNLAASIENGQMRQAVCQRRRNVYMHGDIIPMPLDKRVPKPTQYFKIRDCLANNINPSPVSAREYAIQSVKDTKIFFPEMLATDFGGGRNGRKIFRSDHISCLI